jgi:hypothetical protein
MASYIKTHYHGDIFSSCTSNFIGDSLLLPSTVEMETSRKERHQKSLLFQHKYEKLNLGLFEHLLDERVGKLLAYKPYIHKYDIKFNHIMNELVEYHRKYIKNRNIPDESEVITNAKNMYIMNTLLKRKG